MGLRIQQLPAAIANQIAAGEVIERPASVVKELLENSLDACANMISIDIGYGGLNQIKISDNGHGIVAEDLPLAIAAHATSKITTLDDLYSIGSMGFRGEALASIASIAQLTISSCTESQQHAMVLQCKNGNIKISPGARSMGTTIEVGDLFYNAPVRKKFLKNEKLEFQAIELVVKRFALSAPHIGLTLKHNNKLILSLPCAFNEQTKQIRMTKIFGTAFVKSAIFLDESRGGLRLTGWISSPDFQRSQNDRQWVYINQRMVKDKLINHALKQAYDGLLHPGRFPAYLLYLTIDHAEVDVNVHPTKHEVRFQQPRLVHDFLLSSLNLELQMLANKPSYQEQPERDMDICEPKPNFIQAYQTNVTKLNNSSASEIVSNRLDKWVSLNNQYSLIFIQKQPHLLDVVSLQHYWLRQNLKEGTFPLSSRPLLIPLIYSLPKLLMDSYSQLEEGLAKLGIQIKLQSEGLVSILSIPVKMPYLDLHQLFTKLEEIGQVDPQLDLLIELLINSQIFDPGLLSDDERMELCEFLTRVQDDQKQTLWKPLTVEDCRMLLNV
ncbi:MAG TPA: DNA mismatch repair endonuclease MutL [Legionella sp.]|nr:DNA mismatch repair endonuclease MutL [Legionella sp.]